MRKLYSILYRLISNILPPSYQYITIGKRQIHIKCGLIVRRWLAKHIIDHCGKEVNIERYATFSRHISIGDYSGIGYKCYVPAGVKIGNHVMMGPEVVLYAGNHKFDRTDIPMDSQGFEEEKPPIIGSDVWIGRRVIILPGVEIGDGCVIGAGAVVSKSIPPYSVAVGNPARVVKNRKDLPSNS